MCVLLLSTIIITVVVNECLVRCCTSSLVQIFGTVILFVCTLETELIVVSLMLIHNVVLLVEDKVVCERFGVMIIAVTLINELHVQVKAWV